MPTRNVLGRDSEGRVIDIQIAGSEGIVDEGGGAGVHDHDADYEPLGAVSTHAATPHGGEAGPHTHPEYDDTAAIGTAIADHETNEPHVAADHAHDEYATDVDLTTHAGTAHGTQPHAISGVSHTGTLDHSVLGTVTANQHHNESHKSRHATGGADALAASDIGAAASGHNHDAAYAATSHGTHLSLGTTAGTAAEGDHSHQGGGEAFPVGSVFLSVVSTNPATLLGYGTWSAFGQGRMLLGWNTGDTDEATGGSASHTHADHTGVINHTHPVNVTDPQHAHVQGVNSAATGGLSGYTADTSTNTRVNSGYSTSNAATGISATTSNPSGGVSALTHDSPSHLPPYIVVRMWKRTA